MGHLLYLLGNVNKRTMHKYEQESKKAGKASFAYAWVLDETGEERERWAKYCLVGWIIFIFIELLEELFFVNWYFFQCR